MRIFQKTYTRDTSLVIQELWARALAGDCAGILESPYPGRPIVVDYLHDGAVEIWEDKSGISYLRKKIVAASHAKKSAILAAFSYHREVLPHLEDIWRKGYVEEMTALKDFHALLERSMYIDLIFSYLSDEPDSEKEVYAEAQRLRGADHFFASSDTVVRNSLARFFHDRSAFVTAVRAGEFDEMPSPDECKRRFDNFILTSDGHAAIETLENYATAHSDVSFDRPVASAIDEVRGQKAMGGKARGAVKLLRRIDEMEKVSDGDVIVSPMTTPALMSAIRRAAAIVTDEGGVLCHAAVVARELRIPCVIGTRVATQLFKDGEMVEVDAENGIIRKI